MQALSHRETSSIIRLTTRIICPTNFLAGLKGPDVKLCGLWGEYITRGQAIGDAREAIAIVE
jgi:hypothetical protein